MAWRAFAAVAVLTALAAWAVSITVDVSAAPANLSSVLVWNGVAGLLIYLAVAILVRLVRVERDALRVAATHDTLTGLPNRVLLHDRLEQALLAAAREQVGVGVLVVDLDGFKYVNDARGHHAGDQLLRLAGTRMRAIIRSSDTCARLGGDEFALLLPRSTVAGVTRVAEAVRQTCAELFVIDGTAVSIAASVGSALSSDDGAEPDLLLRVADGRMYEGKPGRRVS